MKKAGRASLLAVLLVLGLAAPGHAWPWGNPGGRARVFVGAGPSSGWGPAPFAPNTYDVLYLDAPAGVAEASQTYVQPAPAPAAPAAYWYYCPSAKGYYPTVPACSVPWIKVPPR